MAAERQEDLQRGAQRRGQRLVNNVAAPTSAGLAGRLPGAYLRGQCGRAPHAGERVNILAPAQGVGATLPEPSWPALGVAARHRHLPLLPGRRPAGASRFGETRGASTPISSAGPPGGCCKGAARPRPAGRRRPDRADPLGQRGAGLRLGRPGRTAGCAIWAAAITPTPPTARPWPRSSCCASWRASSPPWRAPMPWPRWSSSRRRWGQTR